MDDELERILEAAFDGGNAAAKMVSDYIDKVMEGIRVWISVEDCLPEEDQLVLVFDPELGGFGLATYTKSDGWLGDDVALYKPTHWQPLPAPPTDGN